MNYVVVMFVFIRDKNLFCTRLASIEPEQWHTLSNVESKSFRSSIICITASIIVILGAGTTPCKVTPILLKFVSLLQRFDSVAPKIEFNIWLIWILFVLSPKNSGFRHHLAFPKGFSRWLRIFLSSPFHVVQKLCEIALSLTISNCVISIMSTTQRKANGSLTRQRSNVFLSIFAGRFEE